MRTVEQVIADLKKAREAVVAAKRDEDKYVAELNDIYSMVSAALKKEPVTRSGEGPREEPLFTSGPNKGYPRN